MQIRGLTRTFARALRASIAVLAIAGAVCTTASAATVGPFGMAFYRAPSPLPSGPHGTLIWYRPAHVRLGFGAPSVEAWTVLYLSQSLSGIPDAVTGTVIVPTAPWNGTDPRPIVDYAVGTQGLQQSEAPSLQFVSGREYEIEAVDRLLAQGWAVEVTDYAGYTTGATPDYSVGQSEGHAVLDISTAALQIPDTGLSANADTVIWGYSQGGQASAWAAELWPSYDPAMDLVGDAAGGVPANLEATAELLNGGPGAAFMFYGIVGLDVDYPAQIDLAFYANAAGLEAIGDVLTESSSAAVKQFAGQNIDAYTNGGLTLNQLLVVPEIQGVLSAQQLGLAPIDVPMFHYHAMADDVVPLAQDTALNAAYCAMGDPVELALYPGGHIAGWAQGIPAAVSWIAARFVGETPPNNCAGSSAIGRLATPR